MKTSQLQKGKVIKTVFLAVAAIGLLLVPTMSVNNYVISTMVYCFAFAALGVAWNLIGGYGAQISWCHAAFVATGAYTSFLLYINFNITPFLSMWLGMVIAYGISTLIGYGTLRLRGPYFSIATIAFAEIMRVLLLYFKDITGGSSGKMITYRGVDFLSLTFKNDTPFYYIMFVVLCIVLVITYLFEKSKTGYYLGAIKGDEDAAISLGIEAFKIKLHAFQLSAIISSAVGSIFAFFLTYIDPTSMCGMDLSVKIGVVAIIGGVGTLWGPVLGAFVIIPLIEVASIVMGQQGGTNLLYGLALMVVVIYKPDGLIRLFQFNLPKKASKPADAKKGG